MEISYPNDNFEERENHPKVNFTTLHPVQVLKLGNPGCKGKV